jgi:hypothetical protein
VFPFSEALQLVGDVHVLPRRRACVWSRDRLLK